MDLVTTKNMTGIVMRAGIIMRELVIEFRIQYGSNGWDWIDYNEARELYYCVINLVTTKIK